MPRRRRHGAYIAATAALCVAAVAVPAGRRGELTGVDGLVRVYDYILDAQFDQADAELQRACGPAPREACDVLDATAIWWGIQLDPASPSLDEAFTASIERAIASAEAWAAVLRAIEVAGDVMRSDEVNLLAW